jgi:hypothetical protein
MCELTVSGISDDLDHSHGASESLATFLSRCAATRGFCSIPSLHADYFFIVSILMLIENTVSFQSLSRCVLLRRTERMLFRRLRMSMTSSLRSLLSTPPSPFIPNDCRAEVLLCASIFAKQYVSNEYPFPDVLVDNLLVIETAHHFSKVARCGHRSSTAERAPSLALLPANPRARHDETLRLLDFDKVSDGPPSSKGNTTADHDA